MLTIKFKVIAIIIAFIIIAPIIAFAATPKFNSFNRVCWEENECQGVKGDWDPSGTVLQWDGTSKYVEKKCEGKLGVCYAITPPIDLQLSLPSEGGLKGSVSGFAEYLSIFYKFFVAMIAVMAVVMIMWGGFKLIYRGGSAPAVTDAKETIFGAVAALVIALLSYNLLSLVNPALVTINDLRIPKIKPQSVSGKFCDPSVTAGTADRYPSCGQTFTDPKTGDECIGLYCSDFLSEGLVCHQPSETDLNMACGKFVAQGTISWANNAYVDYMKLGQVCANNTLLETGMEWDIEQGAAYYKLGAIPLDATYDSILSGYNPCGVGNTRGYVFIIEVNDDTSLLEPTDDDEFVVGRVNNSCSSISGVEPGKIDWAAVPNERLWQISDFPIVSGNPTLKYCFNSKKYCSQDSDCGPSDTCQGTFVYKSCDLQINRSAYPAR